MRNDRAVRTGSSFVSPRWVTMAAVACIIAGVASLVIGFAVAPREAWVWLLVYFVVFSGIAHGMLAWAATFRVAQTRWSAAVVRLGHTAVSFIPVMLVVVVILFFGVKHWAPWVDDPVPAKAAWLNVPGMVARDIGVLVALWALLLLLVRRSLIADRKADQGEPVTQRDQYGMTAIGVAVLMLYAIAESIIAYDFIMSLSPEWVSTMFAPYVWMSNMYAGMAVLILLAAVLRRRIHAEEHLEPQQFHDMGNLLLGFSLFCMGLFFAQYLTIWYGNLPEETRFLIVRYYRGDWPWLGWTAFILGYAIPFILLQSRRLKRDPRRIAPVSVLVVIGVAIERYVLIVPSIEPGRLMLYPVPMLGGLAFLGAFVLAILWFMGRYSPVSSAEAMLEDVNIGMVTEP